MRVERRPLDEDNQAEPSTLVVHEGGAWSATGGPRSSGCLGASELDELRQHLDRAPLGQRTHSCRALASTEVVVHAGGARVAYRVPCQRIPDEDTAALLSLLDQVAR